mgnify:CR=1 FL=1
MRRPGMLRACLVLVAVAAWTPIGAAERPAQATAASTLDADARERIAVQVVDRLYPDSYGKPANAPIPGAGARSADEQALAAKVARLAKGANPFAENGDPFEAALFAVCAVEQGAPPNTLAAEVEQRRRAEHALDVTRTAGSSVLTSHCLVWLGLYALQGGDTVVARRFLSEAAELSERGGASRIAVAARRNLSLTYALEGDIASALREGEAAGRNLDLPRMPADRSAIGATLYGELAVSRANASVLLDLLSTQSGNSSGLAASLARRMA